MAEDRPEVVFSEVHEKWRRTREKEVREQNKFVDELNVFPNLFSVRYLLHDVRHAQDLLERQQTELKDGGFQYELERERCHNLIIFLQYVLGYKQEAMEHARNIQTQMNKSVIFLALQAAMQWELNYKPDSADTMAALRRLSKTQERKYLLAVAESEIGHFLICTGPRGFLRAMDMLQKAIDGCQNLQRDVYLWKFDLALAIRRNFSMFAYSEHRTLSSSFLANKAFELLNDVARDCPQTVYKARAKVELARLIVSMKFFSRCCKKDDKAAIQRLCKTHNPQGFLADALRISRNDHYVLRECGRQFLYDRSFEKAITCLQDSYRRRKNAIVCQLLGKAMIRKYLAGLCGARKGKPQAAATSDSQWGWRSPRGGKGFGSTRSAQRSSEPTKPHDSTHENSDLSQPPLSRKGKMKERPTANDSLQRMLKINRQDVYFDAEDSLIQAAQEFYLEGLGCDSRNFSLVYDTGTFYEGMRRPAEALKYYERIISGKGLASPLSVVNAYMRAGLCLMELSEQCRGSSEGAKMVKRAQEMFMSSLVECRQAVAQLPQLSDKRASLWDSYAQLLSTLQQSESNSSKDKEAVVHELVGNYLAAIEVHKEALNLAITEEGRTKALHGTISNYLSTNNVKEAKFILDLFLTSDQREFIFRDGGEITQQLRDVATEVYRATAQQALEAGNLADAHSAFRLALVLKKVLPERDQAAQQHMDFGATASLNVPGQQEHNSPQMMEKFDSCVFYEDESPIEGLKALTETSEAVASVMRRSLGLRVSINDEGVAHGRLVFNSELLLAESAPLVVLVIAPGWELSPRMAYIADTVLRSHEQSRVLLIVVDGSGRGLPSPLHCLQPYSRTDELLSLDESGVKSHVSKACHLFDAFLE